VKYDVLGSYNSVFKDSNLLGCDTMLFGNRFFFEELTAYVFTVWEVQLAQHHNLEDFNPQIIKYVKESVSS